MKNNKAILGAMSCTIIFAALVLLTMLSSPIIAGREDVQPETNDLTYETMGCLVCHGVEGKGVPLPNYAKGKVPDLNKLAEVLWLRDSEDVEKIAGYLKKGLKLETLKDHPPVPRFNVVLAKYEIVEKTMKKGSEAAKLDLDGPKPPVDMPSFGWILTDAKIAEVIARFLEKYDFEGEEKEKMHALLKQTTATLEVPYMRKKIDLSKGISLKTWKRLKPITINLMYQFIVLPAGKQRVSGMAVKAFHNKKEIYFYLSWKDGTENRDLALNKFSDACALMFPMKKEVQPTALVMGVTSKSNIWQWQANQDSRFWLQKPAGDEVVVDFHYPFEGEETFPVSVEQRLSAVNDLVAQGAGTLTHKETGNIQGRGVWIEGTWHVVFKRSLAQEDPLLDPSFDLGGKRMLAFAVWDGENGDRGGRKNFSSLVELDIKR